MGRTIALTVGGKPECVEICLVTKGASPVYVELAALATAAPPDELARLGGSAALLTHIRRLLKVKNEPESLIIAIEKLSHLHVLHGV
jgi:hypothetical protein